MRRLCALLESRLLALCVFDAEGRIREERETLVRDRAPAYGAHAVRALLQPVDRVLDLRPSCLEHLEAGEVELALGRVRRGVGRMLVHRRELTRVALRVGETPPYLL